MDISKTVTPLLILLFLLFSRLGFAAESIEFTVPVTLNNIPENISGARINGAQVSCVISNTTTRIAIGNGNDKWTFSGSYKGDRIIPVNVTGAFSKDHRLKYNCELQLCSTIGRVFSCTDNFEAGRSKHVSGRISMKN